MIFHFDYLHQEMPKRFSYLLIDYYIDCAYNESVIAYIVDYRLSFVLMKKKVIHYKINCCGRNY